MDNFHSQLIGNASLSEHRPFIIFGLNIFYLIKNLYIQLKDFKNARIELHNIY